MNSIVSGLTYAALASCLLSPALRAEDVGPGNLVVTQAWSRATPGGAKVAGGYLTIENRGNAPDHLLSGSTQLAKRLEIHALVVNDGARCVRSWMAWPSRRAAG
jgi:periplasmic copper chaperone A